MFAFTVAVDIEASPARVWRALCVPAEVVQWDTGVEAPIDVPPDYPKRGQHVRWRYSNGPFRVLHDRPQEVVVERTLRSLISVGPVRADETYTLDAARDGTRLSAVMRLCIPWPLVGPLAERALFGPATRRAVTASLHAIKLHCEARPTLRAAPDAS